MKRQYLIPALFLFVISVTSVLVTLAYLTDRASVANTFTVGSVEIDLDEADVDEDGKLILDDDGQPEERVKGNEYHLIPGQTYIKDPTVTIKKNSEEAYVRLMLTISCMKEFDSIFEPDGIELTTVFNGYEDAVWIYHDETRDTEKNTITYEFRYKTSVVGETEDKVLEPLFETFTFPGEIKREDMLMLDDFSIVVEGHAIQTATFEDEAAAWTAFDEQMGITKE